MIIIVTTEGETYFVNEKNYDIVSHNMKDGTAVCERRDQIREYVHVTGVAYVPDGDKTRYESGVFGEVENS
jgi:hypothetical protein